MTKGDKQLSKIEALDKKVFDLKENFPIGLADGKMGQCVYFYYTGRMSQNEEYKQKSETLIGEILGQAGNSKVYDIKDGLAGIGLAVDYLMKNKFVNGDINEILNDVDNELFRQICKPVEYGINDYSLQMQLVYYFLVRLKDQKKNSENEYFFREAIISGLNYISGKINQILGDEPVSFNMENPLLQSLYVLSECEELYKDKINIILKEISLHILARIPVLHANRLYLLYVMDKVNKNIETKGWDEHIKLLARETNVEYIIEKELPEEMFFANGLPAIYFLLSGLGDYFSSDSISKYKNMIISKIETSPLWNKLLDDENNLRKRCGLFSGYMGTSLLLQKHYNDENRLD